MGPAQIEWADRWFQRYGAADRPVRPHDPADPRLRLAAGRRRADARSCASPCSRLIGCVPWVLGLALAGQAVGGDWTSVRKGFEYVDYVAARARSCSAIGYLSSLRRGERRRPWRPAGGRHGRHGPGPRQTPADTAPWPDVRARLPLRHAVALGLAQGPTELLPVSSSAHTALIPLLLGWPYDELDGELRKSFEVALHAGAGVALAIDMRAELLAAARELDRRALLTIALSLAPAALAGLALRAADRAPPRRAALDRRRARRRRAWRWRSPTRAPDRRAQRGRRAARRRARARARPGRRARSRRLALRRHAHRRARARLLARERADALLARRAARDARRERAQGRAPGAPRRARRRPRAPLAAGAGERVRSRRCSARACCAARAARARCCPTSLYRCCSPRSCSPRCVGRRNG